MCGQSVCGIAPPYRQSAAAASSHPAAAPPSDGSKRFPRSFRFCITVEEHASDRRAHRRNARGNLRFSVFRWRRFHFASGSFPPLGRARFGETRFVRNAQSLPPRGRAFTPIASPVCRYHGITCLVLIPRRNKKVNPEFVFFDECLRTRRCGSFRKRTRVPFRRHGPLYTRRFVTRTNFVAALSC